MNGKFEGYGHYTMSNGDNYIGEFKNGLFDGKGQLTDKNGNVFDGHFTKGRKEGFGLIITNKGEKIDLEDAEHIVAITSANTLTLPSVPNGSTFIVTALDRLHNESKPVKVKL